MFESPLANLKEFIKFAIEKMEYERDKVIPSFIKQDWFLSYWFLEAEQLEHLYSQENDKSLNNLIISHFPPYLNRCKKSLLKFFPERRKIINEIFFCFNEKQYSAVINLVYSTVEGIIYNHFNQALWGYDNKNKKSRFESLRDKYNIKGISNSIHKRLSDRGEINRDVKQDILNRNVDIKSNNRHLVLHGQSYLYGTKGNAIKAILLFDFVNELIFWEKFEKKL